MKESVVAGKQYKMLTAVSAEKCKDGRVRWNCNCSCGRSTQAKPSCLLNGHKTSCGCQKNKRSKQQTQDLQSHIGKKFGRLTVLRTERGPRGKSLVICQCDCGNQTKVRGLGPLTSGHTTSCGCFQKEVAASLKKTHGCSARTVDCKLKKRCYSAWQSMISRCEKKDHPGAHRYVNRGITYAKKWAKFEKFLEDMGLPPSPKHQLDRIDNEGNYTPRNCRWATPKEQQHNRSDNIRVYYKGRQVMVTELAKEHGLNSSTLKYRLVKAHWPISKALTTPVCR